MKYLHPKIMYTLPCGGVQREGTPFAESGAAIPPAGGFGGAIPLVGSKQGFGGEAPKGKISL